MHATGSAAGGGRFSRTWAEGLELAALVGLLVQSALATALLHFWLRHGASFYLLGIGGASAIIYVVELVAWPIGFLLLIFGRRQAGLRAVILAALLSVMVLAFDLGVAGDSFLWRSAIGVSLVGLVPTACLLLSRKSFTPPRQPLGWLGAFLVMAVMMNLTSDGTGIGHVVIRLGGAGPFTFALADHTIVLMSLLDALWLTGLLVGLVAWWYHPQVTVAIALLMVPLLVTQFPLRVPNQPALPRFWFDAAAIGLLVALSWLAALRKSGTEAGTPKR